MWANNVNRHFTKEDIQTANNHMERCFTLQIVTKIEKKNPTTTNLLQRPKSKRLTTPKDS